jgi:DNA-binding transcriptional MocR family regulator
MTDHGYFALARGVHDHAIVGARRPYSRFEAWTWLISEASWRPRKYFAGSIAVELERGQLAHSTRYLAMKWGWPGSTVRRFLDRLKTEGMIGAETGARITVLTICNYDRYQPGGPETGAQIGASSGAETTHGRRRKETGKHERKESTLVESPKGCDAPARDPKTFTNADWRERLAFHEREGQWSSYWGPAPGAPGCLVPAALLVRPIKSGISANGRGQ